MTGDKERINELAKEMILLNSLGEVITIQIDLVDIEKCQDLLDETFNDSEKDGLYINNMILIRILEGEIYQYDDILQKIVEITGYYECIYDVTALIRVRTGNTSIEMTVEIDGDHDLPNLLNSTNNSLYFQLTNYISTKWLMAKNSMKLDSI